MHLRGRYFLLSSYTGSKKSFGYLYNFKQIICHAISFHLDHHRALSRVSYCYTVSSSLAVYLNPVKN
ncbi:hypothetical protein CapIbe_010048 [Capra ibex]